MGFLDATWHVLNLFLVPVATACLGACVLKWLWRGDVARVPWRRLAAGAGMAGALSTLVGLWWWERDGRMATYALVLAAQAGVWTWQSRRA